MRLLNSWLNANNVRKFGFEVLIIITGILISLFIDRLIRSHSEGIRLKNQNVDNAKNVIILINSHIDQIKRISSPDFRYIGDKDYPVGERIDLEFLNGVRYLRYQLFKDTDVIDVVEKYLNTCSEINSIYDEMYRLRSINGPLTGKTEILAFYTDKFRNSLKNLGDQYPIVKLSLENYKVKLEQIIKTNSI